MQIWLVIHNTHVTYAVEKGTLLSVPWSVNSNSLLSYSGGIPSLLEGGTPR